MTPVASDRTSVSGAVAADDEDLGDEFTGEEPERVSRLAIAVGIVGACVLCAMVVAAALGIHHARSNHTLRGQAQVSSLNSSLGTGCAVTADQSRASTRVVRVLSDNGKVIAAGVANVVGAAGGCSVTFRAASVPAQYDYGLAVDGWPIVYVPRAQVEREGWNVRLRL